MTTPQPNPKNEKLWNWNFLNLWQGQFVSSLGDIIYSIALGFWVLSVTGSTALMGTLMATAALPRAIISPFAGVIVDKADRRKLMLIADIIRGTAVVFVGVAALFGFIQIWMVFTAAVIIGTGGAFFSPSVNSSLPDIVPKSKITAGNSALSMVYAGANILGNPIGGILYKLIGAPFMFLFNGLSYLFSALCISFMKIPKIPHEGEKKSFGKDLAEGLGFVWKLKGLRYLIMLAGVSNFFSNMSITLLLPMFERTQDLGPIRYGITIAFFTGGAVLGMILATMLKITPEKRFRYFTIGAYVFLVPACLFPLTHVFPLMVGLLFVGGIGNAIFNIIFSTAIQIAVPQNMRGKVSGLNGLFIQGLVPVAMAVGGILGEFLPIRTIMFANFAISLVIFIPFTFIHGFGIKKFINYDPKKENAEAMQ